MTDIRAVDLNLLFALDALLAERNVTRAAGRLKLSQPATSAALARLREVFHDPLLIRSARGMLPTARALELAMPVRQILGEIGRIVQPSAPFNPSEASATFTIAASDYVEFTVLPPLFEHIEAEAPSARLAVKPMDFEAIARQLEAGDVDIAIMSASNAPPDVRSRPLYSERFVCVARRDHPSVGEHIDLDTFCDLNHVMVSPRGGGFSSTTDEALALIGRKRRVRLSVPHYLLVPEMVERSDMIAALPERLAKSHLERLRIIEPPVAIRGFTIALVWHERTHRDPAQQWLRQMVLNAAEGLSEGGLGPVRAKRSVGERTKRSAGAQTKRSAGAQAKSRVDPD